METGDTAEAAPRPVPPLALADGVYWLGSRERDEHLAVNSYALVENDHVWVVDPGSAATWPEVRRAIETLFDMYGVAGEHQSYSIIATGPDISSVGCVSAGLEGLSLSSGVRPDKLIIHWRAAMLAGASDLEVEYVDVGEQAITLGADRVLYAMQLAPQSYNGRIALYDESRQVFFSGSVFGSLGADLPLMEVSGAEDEEHARAIPGLRSYYHQFSDSRWIEALRDENHPHWHMSERLICPRFGAIRRNTVSELLGLLASEPAELPEVFQDPKIPDPDELAEFLEETQELEELGYIPTPDMQLLDDSRVRDEESPLLNSAFFDELAGRLIIGVQVSSGTEAGSGGVLNDDPGLEGQTAISGTHGRGVVVFTQLDGLGKLITEYGYGEGDKAIRTFSSIILSARSRTALSFHLFGSDFAVLLPEGDKPAGVALAETLRAATRESPGFLKRLTATFSVVSFSEVTSLSSLRDLARERLRYAWSQGAGSICSEIPSDAVAEPESVKTRVLIVEPDSFTAMLFSEFLAGEGYDCRICSHGLRAFDMALEYRPHIIVSDVFLAGTDVFRLREALAARSETAAIPVIICSYMKDDVTVRRAHALGMYHLLKKPVELSELSGLVAGYARSPEVFSEWSS